MGPKNSKKFPQDARSKDMSSGTNWCAVDVLAVDLGMTVTDVLNLVLVRLAKVKDDSCAYERDDGDLSAIQLVELSKDAKSHMPKGAECGRESLFA